MRTIGGERFLAGLGVCVMQCGRRIKFMLTNGDTALMC